MVLVLVLVQLGWLHLCPPAAHPPLPLSAFKVSHPLQQHVI